MLDVIIPCYNSHKTIDRCLASIAIQDVPCKVTLVNDGGESYDLKKYDLDIQELNYGKNNGPAYARNYGIKQTNAEFITFIDADDMFDHFAFKRMLKEFENPQTMFLISQIKKETIDGKFETKNYNKSWFHGKMFRRSFIEKYQIHCNESSRCCEDASFNFLSLLCLNGIDEKEKLVDYNTYFWLYNKDSLGRKDVNKWEYEIVPKEYIINLKYAFDELKKRNIDTGRILLEKVITMLHALINYETNRRINPEYEIANLNALKICYNKIYKEIEDKVTDNILEFCIKTFKIHGDIKESLTIIKQMISDVKRL